MKEQGTTQHHITYIRDSDRTRVIFCFSAHDYSRNRALELAQHTAPVGFRHAATTIHEGGQLAIPADGDDYGVSGVPVYVTQTEAPWNGQPAP